MSELFADLVDHMGLESSGAHTRLDNVQFGIAVVAGILKCSDGEFLQCVRRSPGGDGGCGMN